MRILTYLFLIIIILLGITFAALNSTRVTINYYIATSQLPLSFLLALALASGCLLGILVSLWVIIKLKAQQYQLKNRLKLAEKEVENLRAIPIRDA